MTLRLRQLQNQKDTTVLSAADMARIRLHARRGVVEDPGDECRKKAFENHEKTLATTKAWANSIVNERQARITRLQREEEAKEAHLREIDAQEKRVQKEHKKKLLEDAERKAFMEKPEIRAVHAQLLLHETVKERQRQILIKERRKEAEQMREDLAIEEERRQIREAEEREQQLRIERKQREVRAAKEFQEQARLTRQRRQLEKQQEAEDEAMLAEEAKRLLDEEKEIAIRRKREAREAEEANRQRNTQLQQIRERQRLIEQREDERIRKLAEEQMDEEDRRAEAAKRKRAERQAEIDKLIATEAKHLAEIKARQNTFEDKQYDIEFEKDRKHMQELMEKQERLRRERRNDYLDAQKKIEAKRRMTQKKATFPMDEETEKAAMAGWELELKKQQGLKELAEFQRKQAQEKREREAAEREREKLEYMQAIEDEEVASAEAQDYAREMLLSIRQTRRH